MNVWFDFPDIQLFLGGTRINDFGLQLCPINHKICRGS